MKFFFFSRSQLVNFFFATGFILFRRCAFFTLTRNSVLISVRSEFRSSLGVDDDESGLKGCKKGLLPWRNYRITSSTSSSRFGVPKGIFGAFEGTSEDYSDGRKVWRQYICSSIKIQGFKQFKLTWAYYQMYNFNCYL